MCKLKAEFECLLISVCFCRNHTDDPNKILLKDLCEENYETDMSPFPEDDTPNQFGNWDTIQNFMTYVSLFFSLYIQTPIHIYSF